MAAADEVRTVAAPTPCYGLVLRPLQTTPRILHR